MNHRVQCIGAITAMTKDRVIGLNGDLPWCYAEDLKTFKKKTINSTTIMGRLTWESIGRRILPHRRNIVISHSTLKNVEHYFTIEAALNACKQDENTWIIGGGQIYALAFDYLTILDITYVPDIITDSNAVVFPKIDLNLWQAKKRTFLKESPLVNIIYERGEPVKTI